MLGVQVLRHSVSGAWRSSVLPSVRLSTVAGHRSRVTCSLPRPATKILFDRFITSKSLLCVFSHQIYLTPNQYCTYIIHQFKKPDLQYSDMFIVHQDKNYWNGYFPIQKGFFAELGTIQFTVLSEVLWIVAGCSAGRTRAGNNCLMGGKCLQTLQVRLRQGTLDTSLLTLRLEIASRLAACETLRDGPSTTPVDEEWAPSQTPDFWDTCNYILHVSIDVMSYCPPFPYRKELVTLIVLTL